MNTTILACPKCHGDMRHYERNGVTVEQCTDCRGLFLDRGELERLIEAEDRHYAGRPEGRQDSRPDNRPRDEDRYRNDDRYRSSRDDRDRRPDDRGPYPDDRSRAGYGSSSAPPKKRSSFLGELLDFG